MMMRPNQIFKIIIKNQYMVFYVISACQIDIPKFKRSNTIMRNCFVIARTCKLQVVMCWAIYNPFWGMYSAPGTFQRLMLLFVSLSGFPFLSLPGLTTSELTYTSEGCCEALWEMIKCIRMLLVLTAEFLRLGIRYFWIGLKEVFWLCRLVWVILDLL